MDENSEFQRMQPDQRVNPSYISGSEQTSRNDTSPDRTSQAGKSTTQIDRSSDRNPGTTNEPKAMDKFQASEIAEQEHKVATPATMGDADQPWFGRDDANELQSRWTSVQVQFVDEPCSAVEQAEATVAETIERVKQIISDQQQNLSQQWLNHDDITTEELRQILRNYRTLLNHLLKL